MMKLRIDRVNDTIYFRLDEESIVESEEIQPGVILDYDIRGNVIGLEILNVSQRVPAETLKNLQFETA